MTRSATNSGPQRGERAPGFDQAWSSAVHLAKRQRRFYRRLKSSFIMAVVASLVWPPVSLLLFGLLIPTVMSASSSRIYAFQMAFYVEAGAPAVSLVCLVTGWIAYLIGRHHGDAERFERADRALTWARRAFVFPAIWLLLTMATLLLIWASY